MSIDMSQFTQLFFEEAAENLADMERLLLAIDVHSPSTDDLNAIFRSAHSIKGSAGTFGFNDMTMVTHELETLLDSLRKEEIELVTEMVDAFLEAGDILKGQLAAHQGEAAVDQSRIDAICRRLQELNESDTQDQSKPQTTNTAVYIIRFTIDEAIDNDIIQNVLSELETIGKPKIITGSPNFLIELETTADLQRINDTFSFLSTKELFISEKCNDDSFGFFAEDESEDSQGDPGYGFFDESIEKPKEDPGYGFFEAETPPIEKNQDKKSEEKLTKATTNNQTESSIRVNIEKVDLLINQVGELVITQAMLAQTASEMDPVKFENLLNGMSQLERNTRDLQESVMSIRMMPIGFVFGRFPRVVRDLASKLNKKINLKLIGESTELDKGLVERLADPLTHLIRNSIDHCIESPEVRQSLGKNPEGTITLRAFHQGSNVIIHVGDDGAGLNRKKILETAKKRGLNVDDNMSDDDVYQLIFAPGFSTADTVTDVSGRGVGMDVVIRNIRDMGGSVDISSQPGQGSIISIRLPLTLAIVDGMSIAVGNETFIIPLTFISESLQPEKESIKSVSGEGKLIRVREDYVPLLPLHEILSIETEITAPEDGILVLVEANNKKVALLVDELIGQHQVVLKSLETNYKKIDFISGATIMGDGRVALILDLSAIVNYKPKPTLLQACG